MDSEERRGGGVKMSLKVMASYLDVPLHFLSTNEEGAMKSLFRCHIFRRNVVVKQ